MNKIFLHVTYDCNAHCVHCAVPRRKEYLPLNIFKKMIDTIPMDYLVIGGGEPLLHTDIDEMIDCASQCTRVKIETNGGLLSEKFLTENKEKLFQMNVSIDGVKDTHNKIRKTHIFDHTTNMISYARDLGIDVAIWSVVMTHNLTEIDEVISLTKKLKVNKLSFLYATPVGRCSQSILVNPADYISIVKRVKSQEDNNLQIRIAPYILPPLAKIDGLECLINDGDILHIDPRGDVYPCVLLLENEKYKLGSVEQGYHKITISNPSICSGLIESIGEDYRFAYGTPICPCRTISSEWKLQR